ncbi:COP9 signalosome complex subunit 8-like, partial [Dendrobates tinctorius]|uniref:COP9 signalosome complex subunit 8-like n=1 Tax=Dendrobates tinctorius TaxID=92724 RepID=UPI003CC9AAA9
CSFSPCIKCDKPQLCSIGFIETKTFLLSDATRRRAFGLVAQAYTSISADDLAAFVGLSVEDAVKGVVEQGWQADSTTRMVMPKKPDSAPLSLIPNEQQLARLTDYVAFLEN